MIKTPLSTVIGGAFWTPGATVIGGNTPTFDQYIRKLFANNEQGFAYDPNDLTTMWQDEAKLLPVTGEGQPVWHILDKSGNNNHAFATSSATRPILQRNATTGAYYLAFDGADDFLVTNNINFTAADKVSLFAGVLKMPATAVNMLCELSSSSSAAYQANAFYLAVPETLTGTVFFRSRATILPGQIAKAESGSGMRNCVITAKSDIPNGLNTVSIDGVLGTPFIGDLGVGQLGNYPLYIGRRGGIQFPFNGHIYGLIGIGKLTSDSETAAIEKELAKRVGVTINV
ncbi:hypothetical protein [Acinetobacter sp. F9]|uniref:hypothetical protein n=1 Tax=Acinetobacter sp. F9 TaxID=2853158 RepID=UPI001C452E8C|nr:hypothetical protein [Acinetobacter sp. F9]